MQPHDPLTLRAVRLSDCRGLGVLLAFRDGDENVLIVDADNPVAIFVDEGERAWRTMPVVDQGAHVGVLVDHVRIEVDITSSFDPDREIVPGALIRHDDGLSIWTAGRLLPLSDAGEAVAVGTGESGEPSLPVGFARWTVVKGDGAEKQTILKIDVAEKSDDKADS